MMSASSYAIGETHPASVLSDAAVETARDLRDELGISYGRLSLVFGVPRETIRDIVNCRRRWPYAAARS